MAGIRARLRPRVTSFTFKRLRFVLVREACLMVQAEVLEGNIDVTAARLRLAVTPTSRVDTRLAYLLARHPYARNLPTA